MSCKRIFLSIVFILLLLISSSVYLLVYAPYQRAAAHELAYFTELNPSLSQHPPNSGTTTPDPQNKTTTPLQPLTYHAFQLSSFDWDIHLQLHDNMRKTAKYPMQRRWVYVGGTPKQPLSWREKFSFVSPPGKGSCVDSPSICSTFNTALDTLAWRSRGPNPANRILTDLSFIDCDHSPALCDEFRIAPVMLLHLETKPPCFVKKDHSFDCSKRWTYIGLPLAKMPFQRKVWIGGFLVPAFPSAEEQLKMLMLWKGGLSQLELEEHTFRDTFVGNEGDLYTFEGVEEGSDEYEKKLQELAGFFDMILRNRGVTDA